MKEPSHNDVHCRPGTSGSGHHVTDSYCDVEPSSDDEVGRAGTGSRARNMS